MRRFGAADEMSREAGCETKLGYATVLFLNLRSACLRCQRLKRNKKSSRSGPTERHVLRTEYSVESRDAPYRREQRHFAESRDAL